MKENKKETSQKTRKGGNQVASSSREKMASRLASKQKNSGTTTQILKSNGYRREKRGKRMRKRVGVEK